MRRQAIDSSSIASVGYDAAARALEVEFRNGGVYRYREVPRALYDRFMAADSRGRFLNYRIKGAYAYSRIAGPRRRATGKSGDSS